MLLTQQIRTFLLQFLNSSVETLNFDGELKLNGQFLQNGQVEDSHILVDSNNLLLADFMPEKSDETLEDGALISMSYDLTQEVEHS